MFKLDYFNGVTGNPKIKVFERAVLYRIVAIEFDSGEIRFRYKHGRPFVIRNYWIYEHIQNYLKSNRENVDYGAFYMENGVKAKVELFDRKAELKGNYMYEKTQKKNYAELIYFLEKHSDIGRFVDYEPLGKLWLNNDYRVKE